MISHSEFLPDCHDSLHEYGFDKAAVIRLLASVGIVTDDSHAQLAAEDIEPVKAPPKTWDRGMYFRQWFSAFEAACIIEGEQPEDFEHYSDYNIPSSIQSMLMASRGHPSMAG